MPNVTPLSAALRMRHAAPGFHHDPSAEYYGVFVIDTDRAGYYCLDVSPSAEGAANCAAFTLANSRRGKFDVAIGIGRLGAAAKLLWHNHDGSGTGPSILYRREPAAGADQAAWDAYTAPYDPAPELARYIQARAARNA